MMSFFKITHEPLLKQRALLIPLIPLIIAAIIILGSDYGTLDLFSPEAQVNFINKAKLPILISALCPILLSVVTNAHRSVQTRYQINATEEKNIGDVFLSHHKYNIETLTSLKLVIKVTRGNEKGELCDMHRDLIEVIIKVDNPHSFYRQLFPSNNLGDGVVNMKPIIGYERLFDVFDYTYDTFLSEMTSSKIKNAASGEKHGMMQTRGYDFRIISGINFHNEPCNIEFVEASKLISNFAASFGIKISNRDESEYGISLFKQIDIDQAYIIIESIVDYWVNINKVLGNKLDYDYIHQKKSYYLDFIRHLINHKSTLDKR